MVCTSVRSSTRRQKPSFHSPGIESPVAVRRPRWCVARLGVIVTIVAATLFLAAAPAQAHDAGDAQANNFLTVVLSVEPDIDGIELKAIEHGNRLQLTNTTDEDVIVLGYEDEPYLRVGPDGVFENTRSPAVYTNRSRQGGVEVPDEADPEADPEWKKVSSGNTARWHDHRVHWMGTNDPPEVEAAPDERRVVIPEWTVPMRWGDTEIVATGELVYLPPPNPLLWFVLATAICALGGLAALLRWWRVVAAVLVVALIVTATVGALGIGFFSPGGTASRLFDTIQDSVYLPVLMICGVAALVLLARDNPIAPAVLILVGGVGAFFGGLLQAPLLANSSIPTALDPPIARAFVAATLCIGAALVALGAVRLIREGSPQVTETAGAQ